MSKRKGMSKKELRAPDEFQAFILELTEKYGNYWKIALVGLVIIILIPIGITVYNYYENNRENSAALQYSILLNKLKMDRGNQDKKLKDINSSISKFKGTHIYYQVLLLKGKVLFDNKKYKEAIKVFDEVISDSNRDEFTSLAKLDKALCFFEMKDINNAKELLNKLTENQLVGDDAKYYLALIYEKEKNFVKAKSYYQEIVDKSKGYPFYKIAQLKLETLK